MSELKSIVEKWAIEIPGKEDGSKERRFLEYNPEVDWGPMTHSRSDIQEATLFNSPSSAAAFLKSESKGIGYKYYKIIKVKIETTYKY